MYPSIFNHFWGIARYRWRVTGFWQFSWANERFLPHFAFPWVRPWDYRGKCYMDRKRIQCLSNASQHVPIYLQPFLRYIELLVENWYFQTPALFSGAAGGNPVGISRRSFYTKKLEWMGYRVAKKAWQYVQPFWYNTSVCRTDGRTDVKPIAITCFSIADARKNSHLLRKSNHALLL